jgi:hypothetical protein
MSSPVPPPVPPSPPLTTSGLASSGTPLNRSVSDMVSRP